MPADGGVNRRVPFRERERAAAAGEVGADGDDLGDAGGLGARQHGGEVRLVIVVIEVRVRVVKNRHGAERMGKP